MVGTKEVSESRGSFDGPPVDPGYLARFAQAHEAAGFDRVLIGYHATGPDGFAVAAHVLNATTRLKVLIAHRPGFVAPTLVARKLATLDQLTGGGRVAIHHITGGDELDQKRDGDFADHDRRYARTAEFMDLLRRELTATEPFDYDGEFYRVRGAYSYVGRCGGRHPAVLRRRVARRDQRGCRARGRVHALGRAGGPDRRAGRRNPRGRGPARPHGPVQPVGPAHRGQHRGGGLAARGGDPGRDRAAGRGSARREGRRPRTQVHQVQGIQVPDTPGPVRRLFGFRESSSVGSERLQQQAAEREVYDDRLWYGVTRLTGPGGNSTALVGTAAQVAEALMAYRRVGVDTVLIRGFDPLDDVVKWGRELVPLLREEAARTPVGEPGAAEGALTA